MSRRGEHAEAERIAHGAVARLAPADMINAQGDARVDLAIVLAAAGRSEEAVAELWTARELFTAKCNLVSAARVDRMLAEQSASIATLDS